jgi:CBS domain containing-hemolysin-like protein
MNWTTSQILIAAFGILIAFVTSAWVNAISRLTKARALRLEDQYPKRGVLLVRMAENPRPYIAVTLLLMLIGRVTATVVIASLMIRSGVLVPEVLAIALMIFVVFQLVELPPRSWVLERPDQVTLLSARPVYWLGTVLGPLVSGLVALNRIFMLILPGRGLPKGPLTSEEQIKTMLEVAESEEVIEAEEAEMIHSIFEFGDTVAREVMSPRPDMVVVEAGTPLDEVLDLCLKNGFSRIPVIAQNIDNIVGIVYAKDVVKRLRNGSRRVRRAAEIAREAVFVPESKKLIELLREMKERKSHMVIVIDEYGGTEGLVTLEDVLEEIVGEISDEFDRDEPSVMKVDDATLRVDARVSIDELNELLGTKLPNTEWDSVGGLVGGTLGRVAAEGDRVHLDGVEFEVEKTKGRRIRKVLVHRS